MDLPLWPWQAVLGGEVQSRDARRAGHAQGAAGHAERTAPAPARPRAAAGRTAAAATSTRSSGSSCPSGRARREREAYEALKRALGPRRPAGAVVRSMRRHPDALDRRSSARRAAVTCRARSCRPPASARRGSPGWCASDWSSRRAPGADAVHGGDGGPAHGECSACTSDLRRESRRRRDHRGSPRATRRAGARTGPPARRP